MITKKLNQTNEELNYDSSKVEQINLEEEKEEPKTQPNTPENSPNVPKIKLTENPPLFAKENGYFDYNLLHKMKLIQDPSKGDETMKKIILKMISLEKAHPKRNREYIKKIESQILSNKIALGTPILSNILYQKRPLNACTVIPVNLRKNNVDDLEKKFLKYTECGIGSGFDFDNVDDPCEIIEKINKATIKVNEKTFSRGFCFIGTLSMESPYIENYIKLKTERDYRTCHYNISVKISDNFMNSIISREEKNINLLKLISKSIHYCGEPGILFMDSYNKTNPIPKYEYKSVAPCAEIAMSEGDVCQFSYVNLSKFVKANPNNYKEKIVDYDSLKETVIYLTRSLDNFIDITINNSIDNNSIIVDKRRIAVGACGFADLLAILKIPYDSEQAIILAKNIFSFINYHSKNESVNLAIERGAFPCFKESRYIDEKFVERFIDKEVTSVSESDWKNLAQKIKKFGIRNSSTIAVPPTGRSSALIDASYSIEPYFSRNDCKYKDNFSDDKEMKKIVKTAIEIPPIKHIEMVAAINKLIDDSISKTVNLPNKCSSDEIYELIIKANELGLKGITFFRDRSLEERNTEFVNKGVKGYN